MAKLKVEKTKKAKKKTTKKSKNTGVLIILGLFLLLISTLLYSYNAYEYEKPLLENKILVDDFFEETPKENNKTINQSNSDIQYIAVIEIPTISLKTGLVDLKSSRNDVDKGVQIIDGSQLPNMDNGNLILAAHSGTSNISYFKDLYKLKKGNKIYVYYSGMKYEYVLDNIYNVNKTGEVKIQRNPKRNTLTLITCTKDSNTEQTVYVNYLEKVEQY